MFRQTNINIKKPYKKPPGTKPKPKLVNNGNTNIQDPVEVFCRIRPLKNILDPICIKRINDTTVQLISLSTNKIDLFYSFQHVFDENTTQKEIFDKVAFPLTKELVNGQNALLFTYGITSSGKTHTLTGNPEDPGILPRTLDVIFNSIKSNMSRKFVFKPDGQNGFEIRSTPDALLEWQREKQINRTPSCLQRTPKRKRELDDGKDWENREKETRKVEIEIKENAFSVFVSYIEIYNNYIYDLLDDSMIDQLKIRQPQSKVLRDGKRYAFVQGVNEVEVKDEDEAFDLFIKGISRRRIAQTALNKDSSRSHSVFNLRVVQSPMDSGGEVIQDERGLIISQFALVDLAGSERTGRTNNAGERLREAGNINNSLMHLKKCIELLRENQKYGFNKIIPYRDNKLTHLFKSYLEGEGRIRMVICVNPGSEDFDESLHVMKFAETAQEVMVTRAKDLESRLKAFTPNLPVYFSLDEQEALPPLPEISLDFRDENAIQNLIVAAEDRKKAIKRKGENLLQYLSNFREHLSTNESDYMLIKQRFTTIQSDIEAREHQIKLLESKCAKFERTNDIHLRRVNELEKDLVNVQKDLEYKNRELNFAKLESDRISERMKERLEQEKERLKRVFEKILQQKQAQLLKEQCLTDEKMHLVKKILTADTEDFGFFRDYWESLASSDFPWHEKRICPSKASTLESPTKIRARSELDLPRDTFVSHQIQSVPFPASVPCSPRGVPTSNPRHLRSLSTGTEKWIDHKPDDLDLGTVLKPKIKNKKSVTNLAKLGADDLKNASKYALTHHFANENGDVGTHVYKGEVIPSIAGGAQVIFNDVEKLQQITPNNDLL